MRLAPVQSRGVCAVSGNCDDLALPARVERVTVESDDGTPVSSWLLLHLGSRPRRTGHLYPRRTGGLVVGLALALEPAPARRRRATRVLLPDPALSTGYGDDFINRGWGAGAMSRYTDVIGATDAAAAARRAGRRRGQRAMGGSFGGYMANWVAGSTDRFRAIVTHAQPVGAARLPRDDRLRPVLGSASSATSTPSRRATSERQPAPARRRTSGRRCWSSTASSTTACPISEALRLWTATSQRARRARRAFLYFPDENHWVLKPQNARIWYETVLGFVDEHARGRKWTRPDLL